MRATVERAAIDGLRLSIELTRDELWEVIQALPSKVGAAPVLTLRERLLEVYGKETRG